MKKVLILQGHPDANNEHFCDAIADKYSSAARSAGHSLEKISIADLEFPLLKSKTDFDKGNPVSDIAQAQAKVLWADHIVVIYPLWLGDMPALVKGFWEQVLRPDFAMKEKKPGAPMKKLLKGRSARIFVTMGMPSGVYRWFFMAHSVKSLKRNVLAFCGFKPVNFSLIGGVFENNRDHLYQELLHVSKLGREAG